MSERADRDESRTAEFIVRYDEQRIADALDVATQRERAQRRHEGRWERRISILIYLVAVSVCVVAGVGGALSGGAFAFVAVPMFILLAGYFVILGLLSASFD